jgi:T5SS/PEP-CTERM-associated repeat protein
MRLIVWATLASALLATPAGADITVTSSASLQARATDFFTFPGHQDSVSVPDATVFKDTAAVDVIGHGTVRMHVTSDQDTTVDLQDPDTLTVRTTQAFGIAHNANDHDRQNLTSEATSNLSVSVCTTKRATFLFSASGQVNASPDGFGSGQSKGFYASGFAQASFGGQELIVGVHVTGGPNDSPAPPSGARTGQGTLDPGCYQLSTFMEANFTSPLLCKNSTGVCQPFQIPPDPNNNPPTAQGSVTLELRVQTKPQDDDEDITWVGPTGGAFDDPNNWNPPKVPTITATESDSALFTGSSALDVDLSALAALTAPSGRALAPRAAGSRTAGRLRVKRLRNLRLVGGSVVLDDRSLDRVSVVVGGNSALEIDNGTVIARTVRLGEDGGLGRILLTSPQAFFTADLLIDGANGKGVMDVRGGGNADVTEVRIGGSNAAAGSASVDGDGSLWTTGKMKVGFAGLGELDIENGGSVTTTEAVVDAGLPPGPQPPFGSDGNACLGRGAGAGVEVSGKSAQSSAWHVDTLSVGGLGCVEIQNEGGIVSGEHGGGDVLVGTTETGEAQLLVNEGAALVVGGRLVIGESGPAKLLLVDAVDHSAVVNVAGALLIGQSLPPAGHGRIFINGDLNDAQLLTSNSLRVPDGDTGTGELTMSSGAHITTTTTAEIGTDGTADANAHGGQGVVEVDGFSGHPELTRWSIGTSLTIGGATGPVTGQLLIRDATVAVGIPPAAGSITIRPGGAVSGLGQDNDLITNGGPIVNDGTIVAPVFLGGTYDPSSHGRIVQTNGGQPATPLPVPQLVAGGSGAAGASLGSVTTSAVKAPPPPNGPVVFGGDADISNTTLVLQFVNGFAPHQGDVLPVFEAHGQLTGQFADVQIVGLAPGAGFDVDPQTGMASSLTDTVALPVVTIKAPAKLKESAKKGAKVKFARGGATTDPLTVQYRLGGSAEPGIDYAPLSGSLVIPAKKKSATLVIVPFTDGLPEANETIELEVLPGADYAPGSTPKATITLLSAEKKPK